jgi:phosphatidylserine/phosphatidylglycerophosphate/cardiolipin synthase-like enzyme
MSDFVNKKEKDGFTCKLWRGERMTLLGFDVADPEPDLVGFAIECKEPGQSDFKPLLNRIAFSYPEPAIEAVDGNRNFDSRDAPFQKFRWIHFPRDPRDGTYTYRVTKRHMPTDGALVSGTSITLDLSLQQVTFDGLVDVGFTRNFASSQAYREQFGNNPSIIPGEDENGLKFKKIDLTNEHGVSVYDWLGFEAYDLLFGFLDEALKDESLTIDVMAYDLNEPDIVKRLEAFKTRLRVIIDDSSRMEDGVRVGHGAPDSPESISAKRLRASASKKAVKRTHFSNLQHHKVFITRRNGVPQKVLCGSTNFTFRGLYIQANNVLVFHAPQVAKLFGEMFDLAFAAPETFRENPFSKTWHAVHIPGKPSVHVCFSPHSSIDLSLNPIRGAVDQATSSVFYSVAFLNQMTSGPTFEAFGRLMRRPIFSYGTVNSRGGLELRKPDGTIGLVDFAFLGSKAPEPFRSEWFGGKGRNVHHKFVVTDFSLPSAKVFTGSSNFSPNGEAKNGDHLIMIEDRRIATAYAIEGTRIFDHLQFRNRMRDTFGAKGTKNTTSKAPPSITLKKPRAISGKPAWFDRFYKHDSQAERDRLLFSK